jgi:hypothetical protein
VHGEVHRVKKQDSFSKRLKILLEFAARPKDQQLSPEKI